LTRGPRVCQDGKFMIKELRTQSLLLL